MAVHPKLMIGAGIAVAGFGLIGAGAGATFTAQISADTSISTGDVGLSLNDKTGSDLSLDVDGKKLNSHFAPISRDLRLKNTGSLDMASTYLRVTATGCEGSEGAALAGALQVTLRDVTNDKLVYDGTLCSLSRSVGGQDSGSGKRQGFITTGAHTEVGGQLPNTLRAGQEIAYRLVIQPEDAKRGLPTAAQSSHTSVNLVFTGFDY